VGWIARANPTYRSKLISFMPKLCHGMNTVIRVKNGCSMSWRETIEGKIYLYGKELAARPMRTAVARCARSLQSIVPLFRRTWARISFAWSLIGRLFVEKPRPDIGHLHKRDFARRHCPLKAPFSQPKISASSILAIDRMKLECVNYCNCFVIAA
jgi:hypothetical protein